MATASRIQNTGHHIRTSTNTSTNRTVSPQHYAKVHEKTSPPQFAMYRDETIPQSQNTINCYGTDHSLNTKEPPSVPAHYHSLLPKHQPSSHTSNYFNARKEQSSDTPTKAFFNQNNYGLTRVTRNVGNVTLPHGHSLYDTSDINNPETLSTPPNEDEHLNGIDNRSYTSGAHTKRNKQALLLQNISNPDLDMDIERPPSFPMMDLD